jgi:GNAT superfamily N-acetyltransferase
MTRDSPHVVTRPAGEADVAALASLRALWAGADPAPEFEARLAAWLADEGDRRTTWLATSGGRPAGMASLFEYRRMPRPEGDSRWGYVGNLFVREDYRRRGIGTALLGAVIAAADERSYARLVLSPSAAGMSLFRRAGFVAAGEPAGSDLLLVRPGAAR